VFIFSQHEPLFLNQSISRALNLPQQKNGSFKRMKVWLPKGILFVGIQAAGSDQWVVFVSGGTHAHYSPRSLITPGGDSGYGH
jgi:hypothetical protein